MCGCDMPSFQYVTIRDRFEFPGKFNKHGFYHPMTHPEHHKMIRDYFANPNIIAGFPPFRPSDYPMAVYNA